MNQFQQKRADKVERFKELAQKAREQSSNAYEHSKNMVSVIPMGQPILVGHHSEKSHRRLLERSWNMMGKSVELNKKAEYYENRAKSVENNNAISSDDPDALELLRDKLDKLQKKQEFMKAVNKIAKSKLPQAEKVQKIMEFNVSEQNAIKVIEPDYLGRIGFPQYCLTNNNGNMSRIKQRIEQLERRAQIATKLEQESGTPTVEVEINGVKVVENYEDNRLQLFFPGKPSEDIRSQLKRAAFRWSPSNNCWQSFLNNYQKDRAQIILAAL